MDSIAIERLKAAGLRVTPQRLLILKILLSKKNHPTAEQLISAVQSSNPHIAIGTIYNVLDILISKKIIRKISTDDNPYRYDAIMDTHHHLIEADSGQIVDYYDDTLTELILAYLDKAKIPNFKVEGFDFRLTGKFTK